MTTHAVEVVWSALLATTSAVLVVPEEFALLMAASGFHAKTSALQIMDSLATAMLAGNVVGLFYVMARALAQLPQLNAHLAKLTTTAAAAIAELGGKIAKVTANGVDGIVVEEAVLLANRTEKFISKKILHSNW